MYINSLLHCANYSWAGIMPKEAKKIKATIPEKFKIINMDSTGSK